MDLAHISCVAELRRIEHPHSVGFNPKGFLKTAIGTFIGTSRKAVAIADYSCGNRQTVAVKIEPRNLEITIASAFVLVTREEGASTQPVIHKTWNMGSSVKGKE